MYLPAITEIIAFIKEHFGVFNKWLWLHELKETEKSKAKQTLDEIYQPAEVKLEPAVKLKTVKKPAAKKQSSTKVKSKTVKESKRKSSKKVTKGHVTPSRTTGQRKK